MFTGNQVSKNTSPPNDKSAKTKTKETGPLVDDDFNRIMNLNVWSNFKFDQKSILEHLRPIDKVDFNR